MIAIVDYGAGNLFSIANALEHLSISYQITQEPQALYESDGVLLPGVGAFPDAMAMLREKDLIPILRQMAKKKPFLGICLGMQVLFCQGEEFCLTKGLGLLKGQPLSVTSEQVLDVSVSTNTQHTATNITDKSIWCFRPVKA